MAQEDRQRARILSLTATGTARRRSCVPSVCPRRKGGAGRSISRQLRGTADQRWLRHYSRFTLHFTALHRLAQPWGGRQLSEATRHRIRSPNIRQRVPTKGLHLRPGFPIEIKTPPYLDREGRPRKILPGVALLLRAADYLPLQVVEYREMKLRNCWMRLPSPMGIVFP